ncbi:uncharacterized protein I206_101089 [Kwoniella pini CBS 10737]|uniref:Uncharacterized protein n=1 Tax=Kwoniella pini CBS 10737 TaxID=1296096 RepID=A0A1B9IBZ3_9TREE|nr:uncharacterized protein I206_00238 [Kwoniella pini CBS 10737]OCF52937.1 hypothetical protein I206_00238 [Kwoniella pini CBS 10737]
MSIKQHHYQCYHSSISSNSFTSFQIHHQYKIEFPIKDECPRWSLKITKDELNFLIILQNLVPHIFLNSFDYELAIAPAMGYERAKDLSNAMVIPLDQISFSYLSPTGERYIGKINNIHSHMICLNIPSAN